MRFLICLSIALLATQTQAEVKEVPAIFYEILDQRCLDSIPAHARESKNKPADPSTGICPTGYSSKNARTCRILSAADYMKSYERSCRRDILSGAAEAAAFREIQDAILRSCKATAVDPAKCEKPTVDSAVSPGR
jgi:hypothetical protein